MFEPFDCQKSISNRPQVFKRLETAIHWINLHPMDNAFACHKYIYPLDIDLFGSCCSKVGYSTIQWISGRDTDCAMCGERFQ